MDKPNVNRRDALKVAALGAGMVALGALGLNAQASGMSGMAGDLIPEGAKTLRELSRRLAAAPRRRNFQSVPMILTSPAQWDSEALDEVFRYAGGPKQVWDNTKLTSPWLNLMRNAMNAQIWAYNHPDFLVVSATHGTAHYALYDDYIWQKYLSAFTKGKWTKNVWVEEPPAAMANPADFEDTRGVFSPHDNSVTVLQRRGAVFLACHNEIWELTLAIRKAGINPDHLSHEEMAAEFTNHLIPGAILTPGVVGTIPELEMRGFQYIK
jgi:hypothetical protein